MSSGRFAAFYLCTLLLCTAAHAGSTDDYAYAWPLQTTGDSSADCAIGKPYAIFIHKHKVAFINTGSFNAGFF